MSLLGTLLNNSLTGPITDPTDIVSWAQSNGPAPRQLTDTTWFRQDSISGVQWNQLRPYQFIVVEQLGDNSYSPVNGGPDGNWTLTLPFPPEAISISTPFAIQTSATMGGTIEEHNGIVFRHIRLSGTTGVSFGRGSPPLPASFDFRNSVLAGTVLAAQSTVSAFSAIGGNSFVTNTHDQSEYEDPQGPSLLTGYVQMRLLELFFEAYAEVKKTSKGRRYRLAFAMWKDEAVYLCSPLEFNTDKDATSPLERKYNIVLKAYKRVQLNQGMASVATTTFESVLSSPQKLAKMLQTIQQVRVTIQDAQKTIAAIGGDVEAGVFEPMRQITLLVSDVLGVPLSLAEMPAQIIQNMKPAIIQLLSTPNGRKNILAAASAATANAQQIAADLNALAAEQNDDQSAGPSVVLSRAAHPANSPFLDPAANFDFFSLIKIGDLNLTPKVLASVAGERARVRKFTRLDYQNQRDAIRASSDALANALNASSPSYNRIYGITAPAAPFIEDPSDDDYATLYALNQLVIEMNRLVVTDNTSAKLNSIAFVAGLANASGIAFKIPTSKFAVPFPYQSTLEQLAARYLKDPDRWMEIATLNGLRSPYIDEMGFSLPLLVNGANNTVVVGNVDNLFIGQPVWIGSSVVVRTQRVITGIQPITTSQFLVSLDGAADLDQYVVTSQAALQAFLPGTVNSQQSIFIPSDIVPQDGGFTTRTIPGINYADPLLAVGGVDWLLTSKNDLVITPNGDTRWAVGLTNIQQKIRLALQTPLGSLFRYPNYGLPLQAGQSLADMSAPQTVQAAQNMFANDPSFSGVKAASVKITGPGAMLSIAVQIAGTNQIIPVALDVTR